MLSRIADKMILRPTRHLIIAKEKRRLLAPFQSGQIEIWVEPGRCDPPDLFVLKFPGTGGRAERATNHPGDYWSDLSVEVWAVNPPGYGGSSGKASVSNLAAAARTVHANLLAYAKGRPILVTGNSLGTAAALHVAANCQCEGLLLRNPPPLAELIVGRFGWWNLNLGAGLIARQVPKELESMANAARCSIPAVFVSSRKDRVVPVSFQQRVYDKYQGPSRILMLANADHADLLTTEEQTEYGEHLTWLREKLLP